MYDVALINLAADARSTRPLTTHERPGLADAELRTLLQAFCEIDAVENAVAEPEIRVQAGNESYLIRTGRKKLMLYDVGRRELPALVLSVDEVLAELDGSALTARHASIPAPPVASGASLAPSRPALPVEAASKPRLIALGVVALALAGAILWLQTEKMRTAPPALFHPLAPAESAELQLSLPGVYMTGNQPGQHGIVFLTNGELKLFELSARTAPRIVHASGKLGRAGTQLAVVTDQPGGLIVVTDRDTLVYCGEIYRRIP